MSILIVDDSLDQQLLLRMILNKAGHQDLLLADSAAAAYGHLGIDHPPPADQPHPIDLIPMDFITKPVNSVELHARVNSALTLKKEMDCRKAREQELRRSNEELQRALREVKVLKGLVPIDRKS